MASTGEPWRLGHRPALDGLRGIAVLLVLLNHATEQALPFLRPVGGVGVTVFFVLSGFLITSLLVEERSRVGRIDLGRFYARRARRLLPALLVMLTVLVAIGVLGWAALTAVLLYVGNWYGAAGNYFAWVNHTWSLAIEEQFYLLWPLVVMFVRSRRALFAVAVGGAAVSVALRVALWDGSIRSAEQVGWWTHTSATPILLGCALAVVMHGRGVHRGAAGLPFLAAAIGVGLPGGAWHVLWMPTAVSLFTVATIYAVVGARRTAWLEGAALVAVGRRSYGLYLWHVPAFNIAAGFALPHGWAEATALTASFAAAWASWRWVEQPMLRPRGECLQVPREALTASR